MLMHTEMTGPTRWNIARRRSRAWSCPTRCAPGGDTVRGAVPDVPDCSWNADRGACSGARDRAPIYRHAWKFHAYRTPARLLAGTAGNNIARCAEGQWQGGDWHRQDRRSFCGARPDKARPYRNKQGWYGRDAALA